MSGPAPVAVAARVPRLFVTIGALNVVSGLAQLAQFGVLYQLLGLWLESRGVAAWRIGLIVSAVWPGMLVASLMSARVVARIGSRPTAALGCVGSAAAALALSELAADATVAWMVGAAALGASSGWRWVGIESWLLAILPDERKARLFSVHETVIYAAQGAGPLLIAAVGLAGPSVFYLSAVLALAAMVPLLAATVGMPPLPAASRAKHDGVRWHMRWRRHAAAASARIGLLGGVIDGMLLGMLGVYLARQGHGGAQTSLLLTLFGIGGVVSQWPLGWVCDRFGLRAAARVLAAVGAAGVVLMVAGGSVGLWLGAAMLGALAASVLTLASITAVVEARAAGQDLADAVAGLAVAFAVGSAVGPGAAGALMDGLGDFALPAATLVACLLLVAASPQGRPAQGGRNAA